MPQKIINAFLLASSSKNVMKAQMEIFDKTVNGCEPIAKIFLLEGFHNIL